VRALPLVIVGLLLLAAPASAAPRWLAPTDLAGEALGDRPDVDVAVAPGGTAVAVWSRNGEGGPIVEAARRRPGIGWSPVPSPLPEGGHGRGPRVGIDAAGDATVTWVDEAAGAVHAARLAVAAEAFEPAQTVSTGSQARFPAIGVGADGTEIVLYADGGTGARVLRAAIRTPGVEAFGEPATISGTYQGFFTRTGSDPAAEVAVAPNGAAVAIWAAFDGRRHIVQTNERAPGGEFAGSGDTRSSTAADATGTEPTVMLDPSGRATAAWTHDANVGDSGNATQVRWSERPPDGAFGSDESVDPPEGDAPATAAPSLAALGDGTVVGAWVAGSGDERTVQAAVRTPGGAFLGHQTLSAAGGAVTPTVRGNAAGDALVTWAGPSAEGIFSVRRSRAGAFGAVQTAVERGSDAVDFGPPAIALDDEGNGTAVWARKRSTDGDAFAVQAAGFDAAPPTVVGVTAGGRAVARRPVVMAASAVDRWSPVSYAWSFGDEGFATGASVRHVYRATGSFQVAVTATDAVGNAAVATATATVRAPRRTATPVVARWVAAPNGPLVLLRRLRVVGAPRGTVAVLRCVGRRCPVRRAVVRRTARGRGPVDVTSALRAGRRRFRAGQTVTLVVTAPRRSGKVVRYRLRRGEPPRPRVLCLAPGATRPRPTCAAARAR
jgi:hypothetical protein